MDEYEKKDFAKLLKHGALEAHRWMNNTDSASISASKCARAPPMVLLLICSHFLQRLFRAL